MQFFEPRPAEALYDIVADPHETQNLAADPDYEEVARKMRHRLAARMKSMPDLSMFPESHLVEAAFGNPVDFGQRHQEHIAKLVDVADLSLVPFPEAKPQVQAALNSKDRWTRYWALIVCSSHGKAAEVMVPRARDLANSDEENLVRVRAAEFLGLVGAQDPQHAILNALEDARTGAEANLILNTLVLLRDGTTAYEFEVPRDFSKPKPGMAEVERRLLYLRQP